MNVHSNPTTSEASMRIRYLYIGEVPPEPSGIRKVLTKLEKTYEWWSFHKVILWLRSLWEKFR